MAEVRVIRYDPDAPQSTKAREAVRGPLLALAHGRDRDALARDDIDLFNLGLADVMDQIQDDPENAVRDVTELLLALDRAVTHIARLSGSKNEAVVFHLLDGRGCERQPLLD